MIKQIFIILFGILIIAALYAVYDRAPEAVFPRVSIGNKATFQVEYADIEEERANGLSGRTLLPIDQGLMFVFEEPDVYGFWMKSMKFPIDIVWITEGVVVGTSENIPPEGETPTKIYYPPTAVDRVLEINAGQVEEYGIMAGDVIRFK